MRIGMVVTEALQAGFALAATIARDSGAKRAQVGLAPDVSDLWCALARDLEAHSKAERRQEIRRLARLHQRPAARSDRLVLRNGPTRPGYTPPPRLLELLARIARRAGPK
jgi:hypothetical protein